MPPKKRWTKFNFSEGDPPASPPTGPGRQPEEHRMRLGDHSRAPSEVNPAQDPVPETVLPSRRAASYAEAVASDRLQDGNSDRHSVASSDRESKPGNIARALSSDRTDEGQSSAQRSGREPISPPIASLGASPDSGETVVQATDLLCTQIESELTRYHREFPSLSGAPQAQQQNASAIWGNSIGLRGSAGPRQQSHTPAHVQQSAQASHGQLRGDGQETSAFGARGSGGDDARFDDRAAPSRTPAQQGSGDDFPPLGGLGDTDLRAPSTQARFNGTGSALYGQQPQQTRGAFDGQTEARLGPSSGSTVTPSAIAPRSVAEGSLDDQSTFGRRPDAFALPHRGPHLGGPGPPSSGPGPGPGPEIAATASNTHAELQQMSPLDRYGLNGLLAQLRGPPDQVTMMLGTDLNTLGLDLNRPEPLWSDWAGPFSSPHSNPIIPEYRLPAAYSVHNVPPLHTRISSFSDETLFMIFYGQPRDVIQEAAAQELYARDWRWHKKMQQWMMKAKEYGDPVPLPSAKEERGWYYFFDVNNWRRERVSGPRPQHP